MFIGWYWMDVCLVVQLEKLDYLRYHFYLYYYLHYQDIQVCITQNSYIVIRYHVFIMDTRCLPFFDRYQPRI